MKWTLDLGKITVSWEIDDKVMADLPSDPELGHKASDYDVRQMAMFETFLLLANNFKFAVLDMDTLKFITENINNEVDRMNIAQTMRRLLAHMEMKTDDDLPIDDSENQSGPVVATS